MTLAPISLPESKILPYARTARQNGCPRDQLTNFLQGGYIALPWTLEFHAAARVADHPGNPDEIGIGGSRGPGKSHAIFAQVALDDCQRFDNIKVLYLRRVGKNAREQFEDLRRKVLAHVPHDYKEHKGVLEFPNGSRIFIGHFNNESDIDQYLGLEYEIIVIEEATSLTVTKYRALRDSNRSSIPGFRPRMYNSTNPGGVGHAWYKKKFVLPHRSRTEEFTRFFPATVDDNTYVDPDYKRKLEGNVGWKLRAYRYGDWDIMAGQYFSNWRHDIHVIRPFRIPEEWEVWASMDYGYAHYNVIQLWAKSGDGVVYTVDEYAAQRQQVMDHARAFWAMLDRWEIAPSRIHKFVAGSDVFVQRDPATPTIADQYKKFRIRLTPAKMDRINGWAEMLARLGDIDRTDAQGNPDPIIPTWYVFDTCKLLIDTLPTLEHNPNRQEDVLKADVDEDGTGGDDAGDCARYGIMEAGVDRRLRSHRANPMRPAAPQTAAEPAPVRTEREVDYLLEDYDV